MQEKIIKRRVVRQLKKQFPNWRRLTKKEKKRLVQQVLDEAMASFDPSVVDGISLADLTRDT